MFSCSSCILSILYLPNASEKLKTVKNSKEISLIDRHPCGSVQSTLLVVPLILIDRFSLAYRQNLYLKENNFGQLIFPLLSVSFLFSSFLFFFLIKNEIIIERKRKVQHR